MSTFASTYLDEGSSDMYEFSNVNHGLFAAGRFAASFTMLIFRPRWVLSIALGVSTIASVFAMISKDKRVGLIMIRLIFFFEVRP